jgi:hypothetical protein
MIYQQVILIFILNIEKMDLSIVITIHYNLKLDLHKRGGKNIMTITLKGLTGFIISYIYNLYKLSNIYTNVAIQLLDRFNEEVLGNG